MRLRDGTPRQKALFAALVGFSLLGVGIWLVDTASRIGEPHPGFSVAALGLLPARADAAPAGLEWISRPLAINGTQLTTHTQYDALDLLTRDIGAVNRLTVRHLDGTTADVVLPVTGFRWGDALTRDAFFLPLGWVGVLVGLGAFLLRPYEPGSWAVLTATCLFAGICTVFGLLEPTTSRWFVAYSVFGSGLVPSNYLYLGFVFPVVHPLFTRRPNIVYGIYAAGIPAIALQLSDWSPRPMVTGVTVVPYMIVVSFLAGFLLVARCLVFLRRGADALAQQRSRILLLAAVFGVAPFVALFVGAFLLDVQVLPDARYLVLPLYLQLLAVGYLAIRQDLINARLAVRRAVAYTLAGGLVLGVVWGAGALSPVLAAGVLLPVFVVLPLFNARVNGWLYPRRAGFPDLRRTIGDELLGSATREDVVHVLASAPGRVCDTSSGAAFLLPGATDEREHISGSGDSNVSALRDLSEEPLVQTLVASRELIKRESLRVDSRFAKISQEARACMDRLHASVLLPIERDGKVIGGLAVGPHVSGDVFDPAELELLRELSHEAVRALEVAQLRERSSDPDGAGATQPIPAGGTEEIRLPRVAGGRFVAERLLGEGGFKRVYLARDTRLQRDVALAMIRPERLSEAGRTRIEREAQAMARFGTHAHIVAVHDIGEDAGQLYIVSEYMPGGSLEDRLNAGPLPVPDALRIASELCDALGAAHAEGIVHRDLKPGNVWFTSTHSAKLGDFGLALAQQESRITEEGAVVGTVAYMSPEQVRGETPVPQSDLYALGVVLYEMLTGRLPFTGATAAILDQHKHATPDPPSQHNGALAPELDALILQLLAKAPADRPATAATVRETLLNISM